MIPINISREAGPFSAASTSRPHMSEPDVVMYYQVCGLCGERVFREDLTSFWVPSRRPGNMEFNAHVNCLQHALHAKIISIFDPDDVRLHPPPDG
jgi:hypothetical protein